MVVESKRSKIKIEWVIEHKRRGGEREIERDSRNNSSVFINEENEEKRNVEN